MFHSYIPRSVLIQYGSKEEISAMVHSIRCTVHILDNKNLNRTLDYLKSAWNRGSLGADQLYMVTVESRQQLKMLNLTYIFDFKRLFITVPVSVSKH